VISADETMLHFSRHKFNAIPNVVRNKNIQRVLLSLDTSGVQLICAFTESLFSDAATGKFPIPKSLLERSIATRKLRDMDAMWA
jgi:hypothetical protein